LCGYDQGKKEKEGQPNTMEQFSHVHKQ